MFVAALLALSFAPAGARPMPPQIETPEATLQRAAEFFARDAVEHEGVPGLLVCVRRNGRTLAEAASGWSDEAHARELDPSQSLPLGSWSRLVWIAGVLRLVEQKKLSLDDDLRATLPELAPLPHALRVRHVLEGSAGLAPWAAIFAAAKTKPSEDLDLARVLALLAHAPLEFEPGHGYAPNGAAWTLLPALIQRASGEESASWIATTLLEPSKIDGLALCTAQSDGIGLVLDCDRVAREHDLELTLARSPNWPARSWCGTAQGVARFGEALVAGRIASGERLERWTHAARLADETSSGHGYALDLDVLAEHPRWFHDGGMGAFRVRMACYPDDQLVVAVLASCPSAPVARIEEDLARLALGMSAKRVLDLPLASASPFTGAYQIGTTRVRILERAGRLVLQDPERELELAWQGALAFVARTDASIQLLFQLDEQRASGFELRQNGTTQRALRMDKSLAR